MREIELKPSRRLRWLFAAMTALALAAVWLAALPPWLQGGSTVALAGLVLHGRRRATWPRLRIAADGRLQVRAGTGPWREIETLADSFVSPVLIVLRYRPPDGRVRSLALLSDSAPADDLRRLRVSLRWARRTRSDTSFPDGG